MLSVAGVAGQGPFRDVVGQGPFSGVLVVPEISSWRENYDVVEGEDHYSIHNPDQSKTWKSFSKLKDFIDQILRSPKHPVRRTPVKRTIAESTPSVKEVGEFASVV